MYGLSVISRKLKDVLLAVLSSLGSDVPKVGMKDSIRYAARRKAIFLTNQRMQISGERQTEEEFNADYDASCDKNVAGYVTDHRGVWVKSTYMLAGTFDPIEPSIPGLHINAMVGRFLGWKLPADFSPDCGISFKRESDYDHPTFGKRKYEPIGTNLLTADQARAMFEYVLSPGQEGR